eukprot:TRINITY_DN14150_c0_g1_i1.p2 TRINITY_DN14150_c0_g1~~TRINITY_DN14150_c0_g1_i1.p2  ORF type:complete len:127 (-),score=22.97 TRINITY_DN14150_c0_g1_i1:583-963(-)
MDAEQWKAVFTSAIELVKWKTLVLSYLQTCMWLVSPLRSETIKLSPLSHEIDEIPFYAFRTSALLAADAEDLQLPLNYSAYRLVNLSSIPLHELMQDGVQWQTALPEQQTGWTCTPLSVSIWDLLE